MGALPSWALLAVFMVSAGVIWGAGVKLSDYTGRPCPSGCTSELPSAE